MKSKNKAAFLTIEVLISMIIVFSAIVTLSMSIKSTTMFTRKSEANQILYITVNSVINILENTTFSRDYISKRDFQIPIQKINGFDISAEGKVDKVLYIEKKTDDFTGFTGKKKPLVLYKIKIILKNKHLKKSYEIYQTRMYDEK